MSDETNTAEEKLDKPMSARLWMGQRGQIEALSGPLGGVEGANASVVIRELVTVALAVITPEWAKRVSVIARTHGLSREEAWKRVVAAGVEQLERAE